MATDGMTVRLHLKRMKVVRVVTDEIDELVIEVADSRSVVHCPACGHKTTKVHETRRVLVRDVPLGRPTTLVWRQRRFECDNCGERHTEDHPEIEGKLTRRLARELVRDSKYLTIRQLSRRHRLSWHLVMGLVRSWSARTASLGWGLAVRLVLSAGFGLVFAAVASRLRSAGGVATAGIPYGAALYVVNFKALSPAFFPTFEMANQPFELVVHVVFGALLALAFLLPAPRRTPTLQPARRPAQFAGLGPSGSSKLAICNERARWQML